MPARVAVGADEVAAALEQAAAQARRRRSRSSAPARAGCSGWSRWSRSRRRQGRVAFGPVTPADVGVRARCDRSPTAPHPLRLGLTEEIPWLKRQTRLTFARCGVIDPLSLDDYRAHGGYKGLERALTLTLGRDHRRRRRRPACAAAAAPVSRPASSGRPWRRPSADRKYIVCNADEGDSGTFADRMLMEGDPFVLIEGMTIAGIAVGATKGYIYIRSEYPHAVAAMNAAIAAARRAGYLGARIGGSRARLRHRGPGRRRRLCLRRGDLAAGKPGGQARPWSAPSRRCRRTRACSASRP